MFGGVGKAGWATILASGVLLSGGVSAQAADLGGDCCADLEERVAELEATAARKGNRVVSLQIYGTVSTALMVFDNGQDSDAFVVDNDAIGSLVGFTGEASVKPGLKAGYKMELQIQHNASSVVTEDNDDPGKTCGHQNDAWGDRDNGDNEKDLQCCRDLLRGFGLGQSQVNCR